MKYADEIIVLSKGVDYVFQGINDIPGTLPEGRTKPWGTGQAVLAAKKVIETPFIVINADDYYGKEGFKAVHEYLVNEGKSCMAGFVLKNTLSDNGGVTRGVCKMDDQNNLTEVVETKNIVKTATGAETDGVVQTVNSADYTLAKKFWYPTEKGRAFCMDVHHIVFSKCTIKCRKCGGADCSKSP